MAPTPAVLDPVEIQIARLEQVRAEQCRRHFARFVARAWQEVDPAPLQWSWHLDAICEHLQAVSEGRIRRLLISLPPGHAKSMLVSVLWPAWHWAAHGPGWRVLTGTYAQDLTVRDATRCRTLIESEWYQAHFLQIPNKILGPHLARTRPDLHRRLQNADPSKRAALLSLLRKEEPEAFSWKLSSDQNVKTYFANTAGGERLSLSVGGRTTGFRGDAQIIDDPLNALDAYSSAAREKARTWFFDSMSSRLNDMQTGAKVVIAQRLHADDVPGHILRLAEKGGEYWDHLRLPSEYDPDHRCRCPSCVRGATSIGWSDPRSEPGELLFAEKFPRAVLEEVKKQGSATYAAQHQQDPVPAGGGMVKEAWFKRVWREPGQPDQQPGGAFEPGLEIRVINPRVGPLKEKWAKRSIVVDATFKKTSTSDFVAIGLVAWKAPDLYLLDFIWQRMGFAETVKAIKEFRQKWAANDILEIGIEDRANGSAIIETLREQVPGVIEIEPLGGKEARVNAATPALEGGNFWIPLHHPQRREAVAEASAFPLAAHDDWLDMAAHAILRYSAGSQKSTRDRFDALSRWGG